MHAFARLYIVYASTFQAIRHNLFGINADASKFGPAFAEPLAEVPNTRSKAFVMLKSIASFIESLKDRDDKQQLKNDEISLATTVLLVHAIAIDGTVREEEMARLNSLLTAHFQLEDTEFNRLLTEAERLEKDAVDVYRFTSVLRDQLSLEEKRQIVAMMWRLVYADGELAPLEDNLIWRVAELLAVPARDRMELKRLVRSESE